jgi:chromosome segregation ATPase
MSRNGSSLPPSRGSAWGPLLWLLLFFCLLLAALRANGQELQSRPSELESLREHLLKAESYLTTLEANLKQRPEQIASLDAALQKAGQELAASKDELKRLRANLDGSEVSRQNLEKALSETSTSLEELSLKYEELSQSFAAYRQEMRGQVAGLERSVKLWRIVGICAGVVAVGLGIWAAAK